MKYTYTRITVKRGWGFHIEWKDDFCGFLLPMFFKSNKIKHGGIWIANDNYKFKIKRKEEMMKCLKVNHEIN